MAWDVHTARATLHVPVYWIEILESSDKNMWAPSVGTPYFGTIHVQSDTYSNL